MAIYLNVKYYTESKTYRVLTLKGMFKFLCKAYISLFSAQLVLE